MEGDHIRKVLAASGGADAAPLTQRAAIKGWKEGSSGGVCLKVC